MTPARVISLITAAGLLLGAAAKYPDGAGIALGTAGFMTLGAWLGIESYHQIRADRAPARKDHTDGP